MTTLPPFHHVTVGADDLDAAGRFYDAVLLRIGFARRQVTPDGGPPSLCWIRPGVVAPRFYVYKPFNGAPASAGNGAMVAFMAPSPAAIDDAWAAGLAAGGSDEGAAGPRPHYAPDYYGAYLRDPQGNKVHLMWRDIDA